MIKPQTLWNFLKTCKDTETVGRVCRALGRQEVELQAGDQLVLDMIRNDSDWMDENVEAKLERDRERKRKKKMILHSVDSAESVEITESTESADSRYIHPSIHPSVQTNKESVCNSRARGCPTWDEVVAHISGPSISIRIPEVFAKEWYAEMTFSDWKDSKGQDVSGGWRKKLFYAWKDKQKELAKKGTGGNVTTNYITYNGKIYTPTQTDKGLRYVIHYMLKDRILPLTTTDETVAKALDDAVNADWD